VRLRTPPLETALALVNAGIRTEEERKGPDQQDEEEGECDFHTLSIGPLVD
jgi:hypothetical protein